MITTMTLKGSGIVLKVNVNGTPFLVEKFNEITRKFAKDSGLEIN